MKKDKFEYFSTKEFRKEMKKREDDMTSKLVYTVISFADRNQTETIEILLKKTLDHVKTTIDDGLTIYDQTYIDTLEFLIKSCVMHISHLNFEEYMGRPRGDVL